MADVQDTINQLLSGDSSVNWIIFTADKEISVYQTGDGNLEQLKSHLAEDAVYYGYLRQPIGAERRMKYVFIKWVGENVKPLKRAKALEGGRKMQEIVKVYHLEVSGSKFADLTEDDIVSRLKAAAGANYDKSQNSAPTSQSDKNTEFSSYKSSSKNFFLQMEKNSNIGSFVYDSSARPRNTPVDLSVRSMTVGASQARANTVDLKISKNEAANAPNISNDTVETPQQSLAEQEPEAPQQVEETNEPLEAEIQDSAEQETAPSQNEMPAVETIAIS